MTKKILKGLYLSPDAFFSKNKGTFIKQTFHFLSGSTLVFFIFGRKMPKISIFKFKLFFQKPKKLKFPIYPLKRYFSIFSCIGSCCTQKVCFIKVHSESSKFIPEGRYGPPKIFKKSIFPFFGSPKI